jgi:hypothetical protein
MKLVCSIQIYILGATAMQVVVAAQQGGLRLRLRRGLSGRGGHANAIDLGACEDFALMAQAAATCAGAPPCVITGGLIGVAVADTLSTGNFISTIYDDLADNIAELTKTADKEGCAIDGLAAWTAGTAMLLDEETSNNNMVAEMGGVVFTPGVHTHEESINIASANPTVYLDGEGDPDSVFIFVAGSTLTTCAQSEIVLVNSARPENVYWVLGTAVTMGADSILVGNVLAGSAITIGTNGKIIGRAISQTAVTCQSACRIETPTTSISSSPPAALATTADYSTSTSASDDSTTTDSTTTDSTPTPLALDNPVPDAAPAVFGNGACPADLQFQTLSGYEHATSLELSDEDDQTQLVTLPFEFNFLNHHLSNEMRVSSNGQINIDPSDTYYFWKGLTPHIAVVLADLKPGSSFTGVISTLAVMSEENSSYIVSWENVAFSGVGGNVNAQVQLFPDDGTVFICWGEGTMPPGVTIQARLDFPDHDLYFPVTGGPFSSSGSATAYPTNECACFYPVAVTDD